MSTLYQALVRYARETPDLPRPYYNDATFQWQLDLNTDGTPASSALMPLTTTTANRDGKETVRAGRLVSVPRLARTSGNSPMLASDDLAYVLGWSDETVDEHKAQQRHQMFTQLTREWADSAAAAHDPAPAALLRFLIEYTSLVQPPEAWTAKDGVLVTVDGCPAHESPSAASFWAGYAARKKGADRWGLCLVCGKESALVETLPLQVKGAYAPGGQSSGVAPISINKAPFGFDLKADLRHVPICTGCALAIPTALNALLGDETRVHRAAESRTTWWVEGPTEFDPYEELDNPPTLADARALLSSPATGRDVTGRVDVEQFHALTVAGNAARLVIKDWYHLPLTTVKQHIGAWFRDIEIDPTGPHRLLPLWRLAACTGRYDKNAYATTGARGGRHPHGITETLQHAALSGQPLPPSVLAHLLQRITADGRVDDPRAALLRLCVARVTPTPAEETLMPGLDPTNTHPCYVLGRLFASYEALQIAAARADGGHVPNATFADKNLAGAISSPQLVLATGERQAAAWIAKLRRIGKDQYHRRDIDQIIALLDPARPAPTRASLPEQAYFVIGYHHQRAHRQAAIDVARTARQHTPDIEADQTTPLDA